MKTIRFATDSAGDNLMNVDIAIVGAGIVGAACAFRLAREGLRIAVVEAAGQTGGGATSAGMGHIVVMDDSEAQFALTAYSQKLWNELAVSLPKSAEYEFCGTIWVAADETEMAEVRRKLEFYQSRRIKAEILDEKQLFEAEPELRQDLAGGLYIPADSVVYQPAAARFFLDEAARSGAAIVTGQRVTGISDDGLILTNGTRINAENVIVAAGAGTSLLLDDLEIVKRKGHLVITERYPQFVRHQLVELGYLTAAHATAADTVAFNIQPRSTGQILIGSSRQFGVEDPAVDFGILSRMIRRAKAFMPNLEKLSATRVWTGFRPATPDNLPYIGRHPKFRHVFLAAGHEGLGITTSLGTAELVADDILGRDSEIPRQPYQPDRLMSKTEQ